MTPSGAGFIAAIVIFALTLSSLPSERSPGWTSSREGDSAHRLVAYPALMLGLATIRVNLTI